MFEKMKKTKEIHSFLYMMLFLLGQLFSPPLFTKQPIDTTVNAHVVITGNNQKDNYGYNHTPSQNL